MAMVKGSPVASMSGLKHPLSSHHAYRRSSVAPCSKFLGRSAWFAPGETVTSRAAVAVAKTETGRRHRAGRGATRGRAAGNLGREPKAPTRDAAARVTAVAAGRSADTIALAMRCVVATGADLRVDKGGVRGGRGRRPGGVGARGARYETREACVRSRNAGGGGSTGDRAA